METVETPLDPPLRERLPKVYFISEKKCPNIDADRKLIVYSILL